MEQPIGDSTWLRLADVLAALSVVTDLGIGREPEAAMHACLLGTRLAECMGLNAAEMADVYWTTLLRYIGCTGFAHEEAEIAGGDEIEARRVTTRMDFGNPRELLAYPAAGVNRGVPPLRRAALMVMVLPRTLLGVKALAAAHCEVGSGLARRLGMTDGVQGALQQIFERWDGKGFPNHLRGDALLLPVRFAHVATYAVAFAQPDGVDAAVEVIRQRSGGMFDPAIAATFLQHGPGILREIASLDAWAAAVAAEPEPRRTIPESGIDEVARAFADMADLKVAFMRGHSTAVAELAEAAARTCGLSPADRTMVRRAALCHDIGRVGVPNGIWEKNGPLTSREWEQVRLHPYHTERILARSAVLTPLARPAGMHHERQDGSGYYRQLSGAAIPMIGRLIAATDIYVAMTANRPYRPALPPEAAMESLRVDAQNGKLDTEVVNAVLEAAGHPPPRKRQQHPAGLSDREVEVLRLIARGSSYREVARELVISPRTAAHHVQHIYDKLGTSSRAAAALFAMEHGLL